MALRPLDEWIADLRSHRDELAAELKRVDEALAALGAGPKIAAPAPVSMINMIITLFQDNPNETYDAEEINAFLEMNGVPRDAATDPVNSVRGALSRLKQRGLIKNVRRGVFQLNRPDDKPDPLGTASPNEVISRLVSEPDPTQREPGDEPPF